MSAKGARSVRLTVHMALFCGAKPLSVVGKIQRLWVTFVAASTAVLFCFVLFGLQLPVCLWWLQVPLRDLSDA